MYMYLLFVYDSFSIDETPSHQPIKAVRNFPLLSVGPVYFRWVVGWYFHFPAFFLNKTFCKQTVEALSRRRLI